MRIQSIAFAASLLLLPVEAQTSVVNVDVGNGAGTFSGQGVIDDPGNDFWNGMGGSGTNFFESDGITPSSVSITLNSTGAFDYANSNAMLADYHYVSVFSGTPVGSIAISGLLASTNYLIYVFSAGDRIDQAGVITLNGVTGCTYGSLSDQFLEGPNYVVIDVESSASGEIVGTWRPYKGDAAINGFQIMPGELPPQVLEISGSQSPTIHSPGDAIQVALSFNDTVTLSQAAGAKLTLDVDGTMVDAVQVGSTVGDSMTFEAAAPAVTTMGVSVVANSLELLGNATLVDSNMTNVVLDHVAVALPNDQISVQGLSVYPPVPGLAPSPHYRFRVREIGGPWQSSFAWFTKCIDDAPVVPFGYFNEAIGGWSHSYCNFEMAENVPIEVEITRVDPETGAELTIQKATPHPRRKVRSWRVEDGKAYVVLEKPALFAVDIDGQMDENPTPSAEFINETALHGVSVFANPFILDKPSLTDPNVLVVEPGSPPPNDNGPWTTLYFKPGVHELYPGAEWVFGDAFRLRSNRSYYIPGDAIVHGNMTNDDDGADGQSIRIFGHGTLSGEQIDHPTELGFMGEAAEKEFRAIRIADDAKGCRVEGLTIADPANHSLALVAFFNANPADLNYIRWCKTLTWRANGDGISPNGSGYIEDCFLRTQDDGTYILGLGIRRIVYWSDVNGMPLRCSSITRDNPAPYKDPFFVEDLDVIYARTGFGSGTRRSIFGTPTPLPAFPGNTGSQLVFRNINVEDPFPTRQLFGWDLQPFKTEPGGDGEVSGVRFENVRAVASNVDGDIDAFLGTAAAPIQGLTFDDVIVAGEHYDSLSDFDTNSFVSGFVFEGTAPETKTFRNTSGYGKWLIQSDWDTGDEPANNDLVQHTFSPGALIVDGPAYAGSVSVGHPQGASLRLENGGVLTVTDSVSIGGPERGNLSLIDGTLRLENSQSFALSLIKGTLYLESGEIHWEGDHVADARALYASKALTFSKGQPASAVDTQALSLAQSGGSELYARYDAVAGMTTIWVVDVLGSARLDLPTRAKKRR